MCFHSGMILLCRASLTDEGEDQEQVKKQCSFSANTVTALLRVYHNCIGDRPIADPMVVHAALTAAAVHIVQLRGSAASTYLGAVRSLKGTLKILATIVQRCGYADIAYRDLRQFAKDYDAIPANADAFWALA